MTRRFNPENLNFLGTCFSLVSHSEQFSKNFYSVNSSLLLKQQRLFSSNSRKLDEFTLIITNETLILATKNRIIQLPCNSLSSPM